MKVKDLHDYDIFYLQLTFFLEYSQQPRLFNWQCSKRHYDKNMDKLFKNEELIERFGDEWKNVKTYIEHLLNNTENCSYGLTIIFLGLKQYKRF